MNKLKSSTQASTYSKLSFPQFGIYAVVGAVGTFVHFLTLYLLVEYIGLSGLIGSICGSIFGALINFFLNHRITFRSAHSLSKTAPSFFTIAVLGLMLNAGLMYVFLDVLRLQYLIAQLIATAIVLCLNYVLNAVLTFGASPGNVDAGFFSMKLNRSIQVALAIFLIAFCSIAYNWWLLDQRNFFRADDWDWLNKAAFWEWSRYFSIMPIAIYNDRPVGALFIKAVYQIFSLNYSGFQAVMLGLHTLNCVAIFAIASRYISWRTAFIAALLSATWFSTINAVGWNAAIFDVLGATLCLATILLRQASIKRGGHLGFEIAGVLCYVLAIRTKEFALGMIALLFVMSMIAERQKFRQAMRSLLPYFMVFCIYLIWYIKIYLTANTISGSVYAPNFSPISVLSTLCFYFSKTFYQDILGLKRSIFLIAALVIGIVLAWKKCWRPIVFGLAGFVILLGPTLLLSSHLDVLYLYAPHFFIAITLCALIGNGRVVTIIAILIAVILFIIPLKTVLRKDNINFYLAKGEINSAQLNNAKTLLSPLKHGTTIFISGVDTYFNAFSYAGNSIRIAFHDETIVVKTEKPETELAAEFCKTAEPKKFLRFIGGRGMDITTEIQATCAK